MTTNGHVANPQPGDLAPERRPVKRTLFVEEEDNGIKSVWEATDEDLAAMGWVRAEQASEIATAIAKDGQDQLVAMAQALGAVSGATRFAKLGFNAEDARPPGRTMDLDATPSGEAVRMASERPVVTSHATAKGFDQHDCPMCGAKRPPAACPDGFGSGCLVTHVGPCPKCDAKDEPLRMVGKERAEVEAAPAIDPEAPLTWAKSEIREQVVKQRKCRYGEALAYDDGKHALQVVEALIDVLEARERRGGA